MDINDIIGEIIDINDTTDRLIAYTTMIMHLRNLREQIGFNDIRDAVIHGDKLTKINKLLLEKFISIIDENIQSIRKQLQSVDERTKALTELALNRFVANHDVGCTYILQSDLLPSERNLDIVNHKYIEVIPILLDLKLQLILI